MKKLLAVLLAVAMLMSMAVVASAESTFATPVELGLFVGGWGADDAVTVSEPGVYNLSWEGDAKSFDWLIVKNTAGESEPTSIPEGTVISITELKIDGTAYTFDGGNTSFDYNVASEGKIEIKPWLNPAFGGADHIDSNPKSASKVEVTFSVVAPEVPEEPEEPAFNPIVTVFESEVGESFNCVNPWDGFGIGEVAVNGQSAGTISLAEIKDIVANGGATFNMIISGTGVWNAANPAPQAHFSAWALPVYDDNGERYDGDDDNEDLDTAECEMTMKVSALEDGTYQASIKLDDLLSLFTSKQFGTLTVDDITNFAIQVYTGEFKLYKAWFELPEPKQEITVDPEDVYKALESQIGTLDGVSGDLQLMGINTVNTGESIVLHFIGTTTGAFRYWISQGAWVSCSDITTVTDTEFDVLVEIVANKDGANSVQFKGPAGGALDNLTLTYVGVYYGTMEEYEEAYEAKKEELEAALNNKKSGRFGAYVVMGDEYHAQIGKGIIITTEHVFDETNTCVLCGHYVEPVEDEIIIEVTDPVEPSTDEEEDVTVDVEEPADEPAEEENPKTGLALAIIPMIVAAAAVVISKR